MFAFIGVVYVILVFGIITFLVLWASLELGSWMLRTSVGTFNALFLGLGESGRRVDEQRQSGREWNAIRPPDDAVPMPSPFIGRVIVFMTFWLQALVGVAVACLAFGAAVPQTTGALRAIQGLVVFGILVGGIPAGVFAMGWMLSGMLPTTLLRGTVVAVLYHVINILVSVGSVLFMNLIGVPFAVGLVRSLQQPPPW